MAFCPKCGKKQEKHVLCSECAPIKIENINKGVVVCPRCTSVRIKNKWENAKSVEEAVKREASSLYKIKIKDLSEIKSQEIGKTKHYYYECESKGFRIKFDFSLINEQCPSCSNERSTYFEGILQIRNANQQVMDFIQKEIESVRKKKVFVTKIEEEGDGIDYYLTNKTFTLNLGRKVASMFGGTVETHEKLFSRDSQTSRDLFRVNVLVNLPDALARDIVEVDGKVLLVTSIGKEIKGIDLKENKRVSLKYKESDMKVLERKKTSVTKVFPHIEVLSPTTFQSVKPENDANLQQNENIKVVEDTKGRVWVAEIKKLKSRK